MTEVTAPTNTQEWYYPPEEVVKNATSRITTHFIKDR